MNLVINLIAICLYLVSAALQGAFVLGHTARRPARTTIFGLGLLAVALHAGSLFNTLFIDGTVDLGFFHVSSLIFWFITTMTLLGMLRRPLENVLIALFPLAALSILVSSSNAPLRDLPASPAPGLLAHILLSILAYAMLTIAAMQAVVLAIQERELKHRHVRGLLNALPALQVMEQLLFEVIALGMLILTAAIVTGLWFIDDIFAQHLVHKTTLSIAAWLIFGTLLWGHHRWGWRGATAVRWTLCGFVVLMAGYFGSKLVLELILQRT